jgi:glucokinase
MSLAHVGALDIGGTHVTAALVDVRTWTVVDGSTCRRDIDSGGDADAIAARIAEAATCTGAPDGTPWGIAIPGPFDYRRGIGDFRGVGKFDAFRGVDVGQVLHRFGVQGMVHFLNDADAFGIGEWTAGAARGCARAIVVTLGTGVGSAFLVDGEAVHTGPGVPPEGRLDLLHIDGRPLERTISRAAIRARYAGDASLPTADVQQIAELARSGDVAALAAVEPPVRALGRVLGPRGAAFAANVIVVGGAISAAWDVIEGPLRDGMEEAAPGWSHGCDLQPAQRVHDAALLGAAWSAARAQPTELGGSPT